MATASGLAPDRACLKNRALDDFAFAVINARGASNQPGLRTRRKWLFRSAKPPTSRPHPGSWPPIGLGAPPFKWWLLVVSIHGHPRFQRGALPTELSSRS